VSSSASRILTQASRLARAARTPRESARVLAARLSGEAAAHAAPWVPPGHFYSPYPDLAEYERRAAALHDPDREIVGVDLRAEEQLALLDRLAAELAVELELPEQRDPTGGWRYWLDNPSYAYGDGVVLHAMLRYVRPRRIVEVGSGFSSALILDTVDRYLPEAEVTFVEPYPELLESLLRPGDDERVAIHRVPVQDVDLDVFTSLERGDVLFIDSTHVSKAGSDVNHLFFEVIPRLAQGVWIHLHDIFHPFEYPDAWIREGRAWHEIYLLRAFLTCNTAFVVRWFQDFLWTCHREAFTKLPWVERNAGGNVWLQRVV